MDEEKAGTIFENLNVPNIAHLTLFGAMGFSEQAFILMLAREKMKELDLYGSTFEKLDAHCKKYTDQYMNRS